jgi:hypothetical protein
MTARLADERHTGLWISAANILVTVAAENMRGVDFLFVLGYTPLPPGLLESSR